MATKPVLNNLQGAIEDYPIDENFTLLNNYTEQVNSELVTKDNTLASRIEIVNDRVGEIIAQSGTSDTEVVDARDGLPVLNDRFEALVYLQDDEPISVTGATMWYDISDESLFDFGGGLIVENAETNTSEPTTNIWFQPV